MSDNLEFCQAASQPEGRRRFHGHATGFTISGVVYRGSPPLRLDCARAAIADRAPRHSQRPLVVSVSEIPGLLFQALTVSAVWCN